jgi:hypothetical protein
MPALTWPKFAALDPGPIGLGGRVLRSSEWSELDVGWISQNNPLPVRIVGRSPTPAFAAGAFSDLWPGANPSTANLHSLQTAEKTLAVASDSATDSNGVSGAWQITVPYLDASYAWHYAVFALNGQTKVSATISIDGVATTGPVTHCFRVLPFSFVSAASPGVTQVGNVYIGDNADAFTSGVPAIANTFDWLLPGDNRSHSTCLTVPAGMGFMPLHLFTMNTAAGATAFYGKAWYASARWPGVLQGTTWTPGAAISPWQRYIVGAPASTAGILEWYPNWPDIEPPQSEIKVQCASSAVSGEVSAVIEGVLFPWPMVGSP